MEGGDSDEKDGVSVSSFYFVLARVAVAQICRNMGLRRFQPSALDSLTSVALFYLQHIGRYARRRAEESGRTESNFFDVVRAVEELTLPRGFVGASDVVYRLENSRVLKEIMEFVDVADEVRFPKVIRKERTVEKLRLYPSFRQLGQESPLPHVPEWLPAFPAEKKDAEDAIAVAKREVEEECIVREDEEKRRNCASSMDMVNNDLPEERLAVTFKLGISKGHRRNGKRKFVIRRNGERRLRSKVE